ncbi:hypothetical protein RA27_17115, partial [Ruegeria sp. ANG-R]|uniref:hypothetical protein n=1 Tax=Ruegeria sp. ANG-R TaxID=1577903 RepID=UPI00057D2737
MTQQEIEIPKTTITQRALAGVGYVASKLSDVAQATGATIELGTEKLAKQINQRFVNDPTTSAVVSTLAETVENTVLTTGKLGKVVTSLASVATSWSSSLSYYSAGTLRNNQLEEAGIQPIFDTDILAEVDFGSVSTSFSIPSFEEETALLLSRRQLFRNLDDSASVLRELIDDPSFNIENREELDRALTIVVNAGQLRDGFSTMSQMARYIGENLEELQSATNRLSMSLQTQIDLASRQFDELNPYIGDGFGNAVETYERLAISGIESADAASDAAAAVLSLFSVGGALVEEYAESVVSENLSVSDLIQLPLSEDQKQILLDTIYKDGNLFAPGGLFHFDLSEVGENIDGAYERFSGIFNHVYERYLQNEGLSQRDGS